MDTKIPWVRPSKKSTVINRPESVMSDLDKLINDASIVGDLDGVVRALDKGASVNARDTRGSAVFNQTPIMWAAKGGYTKVVCALVARGADVNAVDTDKEGCAKVPNWGGLSALHYAFFRGNWRDFNVNDPHSPAIEAADALLNAGANPNIVSGQGIYILDYYMSYFKKIDYEIMEKLLACGADPDFSWDPITNPYGQNILFTAISRMDRKAFRLLLKFGATLNHQPSSKYGVPNVASLVDERRLDFVDRGMLNIDIASEGVTVLMGAVRSMSLRSVEYCLSGPCKTINYWCSSHNAPDAQAWTNQPGHETALDMAIFVKQREIEKLLVAHGAKRYQELTTGEKESNTFEKKPGKGTKGLRKNKEITWTAVA